MNRYVVRLFARYAEVFRAQQVEVTLPEDANVADLIDALRILPGGALLPVRPLVAINMRQADLDAPLRAQDEVALLPPLAGG